MNITEVELLRQMQAFVPTLQELLLIPNAVSDLLGSGLLKVSDEDWQRAMHAAPIPCGKLCCKCHIRKSRLYEVLDFLRDEAKEGYKPHRNKK